MRTVDYSDVLNGTAAMSGMGPDDIGVAEFALLRQFHDRRLQKAWEIHHWPEICRVEQRTFRPTWSSTTTYAATAERYDPTSATCYQSLQGGNLNNPPTIAGAVNSAWWAVSATQYSAPLWVAGGQVYAVGDQVQNPDNLNYYQCFSPHTSGASFDLTKFGLLTAFDRYVAFDQVQDDGTALTPIGEFLSATDGNPRTTTKLVDFPFWISENGAQFTQLKHAISFVWVQFRLRRPFLSGDTWDQGTTYAVGGQAYYKGTGAGIAAGVGNFYTANAAPNTPVAGESPESAPTKWSVVQIPYIFRGYLITGGYADWLTGDGQANKASGYEGVAVEALELEADKLQRQSGQVRRLNWK